MNDFFITLEVPELNSHYAQNLQQLVLNINSNFAKIASLPFLKGDSGVSIETYDEPLYIVEEGGTKVYTDFGKSVIKAIYGVDSFPTEEFTINGIHSYDDLMNVQYIPVFYDKVQGLKYLTVPFMFHDKRKNELGMVVDDMAESFEDMSTFVIGKMIRNSETGETEWVLESHNFEPKLYYNTETQKFCWAIGSQKTDIIAQGVEGRAGQSVYAKYCQGMFIGDDRTYIYLNTVLNENDLQDIVDGGGTINDCFVPIDDTNLSVGDFVMVLYNKEVDGGTIEDLSFGKVMEVGGSLCIPYLEGTTIYNSTQNVTLKALLDTIGKTAEGTTTTPNVRGLYVYGETEQSANNNGRIPRTPHMLWVDGDDVAHLSKLKTNITDSEGNYVNQTTQNNPAVDGDGVLQVDYDKFKAKESNATLFTHRNGGKVFSYGVESNDKLELLENQNSITDNIPYKLCFIPNPELSYAEKPQTTSFVNPQTVTNTDFLDVKQQTNSNTNNNKKTIVGVGGTFTFDLPYLGMVSEYNQLPTTQSVTDIKQTTKFKRSDGSVTPLSITLKQVELNNNETPPKDDEATTPGDLYGRNETDNTYVGFRHFLDIPLLASPISTKTTITGGKEVCVYCGTTEDILEAKLNNKTYKTKIRISVIQYEIGYNLDGEMEFKQGSWKSLNSDLFQTLENQCTNEDDWYYPVILANDYLKRITHKTETYKIGSEDTGKNITKYINKDDTPTHPEDWEEGAGIFRIKYNKYASWVDKISNYPETRKNVITDVIYYLLPIGETTTDYTDVYNIVGGETNNYLSLRYRVTFAKDKQTTENIHTIYINPITENRDTRSGFTQLEPIGVITDVAQSNSEYYSLFDNSNNPINNYFCPNYARYTPTSDKINGTSDFTTFNGILGQYNDFVWCCGEYPSENIFVDGAGCGRMLPVTVTRFEDTSKWILLTNEPSISIPNTNKFGFVTQKQQNDGRLCNELSTNINPSKFGITNIGDLKIRLNLEGDNGWYINNERIQTVDVTGEKIFKCSDIKIQSNTVNGGGSFNGSISGDGELNT